MSDDSALEKKKKKQWRDVGERLVGGRVEGTRKDKGTLLLVGTSTPEFGLMVTTLVEAASGFHSIDTWNLEFRHVSFAKRGTSKNLINQIDAGSREFCLPWRSYTLSLLKEQRYSKRCYTRSFSVTMA